MPSAPHGLCVKQSGTSFSYRPCTADRALLAAIEDGLPLVRRPFRAVANDLGVDEADVVDALRRLIAAGVITRFGCVVHHRSLGYRANAMAVWNIPDGSVDAIADRYARNPRVTLCYRRPRRPPDWPYNLFCMVHARTRRDAYAVIDDLNLIADTGLNEQAVLFSTRCFKQRGASFSESAGAYRHVPLTRRAADAARHPLPASGERVGASIASAGVRGPSHSRLGIALTRDSSDAVH